MPPTPRSPRPRTREPSVTTCVDEYEYAVDQESGATLLKSVSDTTKNIPDRVQRTEISISS